MRAFKKTTATRELTLSNGEESLSFTIKRPPLLFMDALNRAFPRGEDGTAEADYRQSLRVVIIAAAGLAEEGLPPHPDFAADEASWRAYGEHLFRVFDEAGFSKAHLTDLYVACLELVAERHGEAMKEAMREAGNG